MKRFPRWVLEESIEAGLLEEFTDERGVERVRLTPAGARLAGMSEREIRKMVAGEKAAGRPYRARPES